MADTDFNIENLRIKDLPPMPEPNPAQYRQRAVKENLIGCPLWWLQCVLPIVKSKQQLVVAIYLWRRRIVCGNCKTFDIPNSELKTLGISRQIKYRTLERLAAAGPIQIDRRSIKAAPTVTILAEKPRS
jgi:hypothetical protein